LKIVGLAYFSSREFDIIRPKHFELFKKCWVCGEVKSLKEFYRDSSRRDGHDNKCKKCTRERKRRRN